MKQFSKLVNHRMLKYEGLYLLGRLQTLTPICFPPFQPAVHVQGQEPLTASMLAAAPPQEQKQMLG